MESWLNENDVGFAPELIREMKLRAADEGRKLRDVATEIFRRGLMQAGPTGATVRHRVKLPLIHCGAPMAPAKPLTADQVADVLLKQEVEWSHEAAGR